MSRVIFALVLLLSVASVAVSTPAATDAIHNRALADVVIAANEICFTPPLEHHESQVDLTIDAKAKVNGIIGKLANLGVDGAAKYRDSNARGLFEKDWLPPSTKATTASGTLSFIFQNETFRLS